MDAAINCLERELASVATGFAVVASRVLQGGDEDARDPESDEQQNTRWQQMNEIRNALSRLRSRAQYEAECREGRNASSFGNQQRGAVIGEYRTT